MGHAQPISTEDLLSHLHWARALARRLVADDATADDVVQESLIVALKRPPRDDRPVRPWLGSVVRNAVRQRRRGERRRAAREGAAVEIAQAPSAADLTERAEAQRLLINAVLELDETSREIVLLRYFENLSSAEIARRMGRPASTVRSRLKRSIDELRARLEERFGGNGDAWRAVLMPLARPHLGTPTGALAGWGTLMLSVGAVAAVVVALVAGGRALLGIAGSTSTTSDYVVVEVPVTEDDDAPALAAVEEVDPASDERSSAAPNVPTASTKPRPPVPVPGAGLGQVTMRFVDRRGVAVSGVEASNGGDRSSTSGLDGRVSLDVWYGRRGSEATVSIAGPTIAVDTVEAFGAAGTAADLGEIIVHPGGTVDGRVVDADGNGIASLWVEAEGRRLQSAGAGSIRSSTVTGLGSVRAVTDESGRFRMRGLLAGDVELNVGDDKGRYEARSMDVHVLAGRVTSDVQIVAAKVDPATILEGTVLGPDGRGAPYVHLRGDWRSSWLSKVSCATVTDRDGRFRLSVGARAKTTLEATSGDASDGEEVLRARLADVRGGARDLMLQLAAAGKFELEIVDERGRGVTEARIELRSEGSCELGVAADPDGVFRVTVPSDTFHAHVLAEGHAEAIVGPFDPEEIPGRIRVAIEPIAALVGAVNVGGAPVEGARVFARSIASEKILYSGLPCLVAPQSVAEARTDATGRFALTVRKRGRYVIRVEHEGMAPYEWPTTKFRPSKGLDLGTAELDRGGAIEGVVLDGDSIDQRHNVLISRGDGKVDCVRTAPDGTYRFTGLTPGPWMVRVVPEFVHPDAPSWSATSFRRAYRGFDADCFVTSGKTTRFDPRTGDQRARVSVRGTLALDGVDTTQWSVELIPADVDAADWSLEQPHRVGADGTFHVEGGSAGSYVLLFVHRASRDEDGLRLIRPLELGVGETPVEIRGAFGSVSVDASLSREGEYLLCRADDGTVALAPIPESGTSQSFLAGTVQRVGAEAILLGSLDFVDVREEGVLSPGGELLMGGRR